MTARLRITALTGTLPAAVLLLALAIPAGAATPSAPAAAPPAALDRTKPPALAGPPALKLPAVQVAKLANGLELAVVEMHEVPVVDVTLLVRAGGVRDPRDLPGLATFTANMLDEGAGTRDALGLADEIQFLGARLTTSAGPDNAVVNLHCTKPRLAAALDLMADVVLRPALADSEITRQRELRKAAILQLRDQPTQIAPIAFNAIVFGSEHPYGWSLIGNDVSTAKLDRERVRSFYEAYYRPNNSRLLVVGDVTLAEAKALIEARFGAWKRAEVPAVPQAAAPAPGARTFYLVDKPGAAQSVIRIGEPGVSRSSPDYFPLRVFGIILGGSFSSRLNQNLRETHGYTYGARAAFDMRRMPGAFVASASVVTAKTDSSLIEFFKELRRIRAEAVPAAEVEKAKSYLALGLPGNFETTADAAGQYLDLLANDLPLDEYGTFMQRIGKVTVADVQRVARQYTNPDHFAVVVVGDRKTIEDGIRALHEGPIVMRDLWGQEIH
jgi:predicted Zn-dependent peptidase